jgi:large subunit ribosomal protein L32
VLERGSRAMGVRPPGRDVLRSGLWSLPLCPVRPISSSRPVGPGLSVTVIVASMAVPKRRMSRSNTRARRSQWKATAPDLVPITVDGKEIRVPRYLVKAYQRGVYRPEG